MIRLASTDDLLDNAFQLACFILNDRDAALRVVRGALAKLEVASAAQGKRLYYKTKGRDWSRRSSNRFRNNVSFNEPHLLQRLIYIESEPYEIAQEQTNGSAAVGEEDLVIHFIKHLTKKTIKRNSFYVTLGLSRLLYSYTTAETMDIYNAVIQDPERVKDDYYYRSRKGVLMHELKQRFGDLINICRGPRGEERFQAHDNQKRFVELVRECLGLFTPWHTPCIVPAGIDPITDGIPSFSHHNHNDEDKLEVNRIHAVLHPACFQRLTNDLRFDDPEARLEIPRFFYESDENQNGSNITRRNPPKLNEQELMSITEELDSNAARRKTAHAGMLRILVDGAEHARINLGETRSTRFRLNKDAELIEVRLRDNAGEEALLASHLLTETEADDGVESSNTSIILEGGQKICVVVSPNGNGGVVDISYRETNPFRAGALWFHQLPHSLNGSSSRTAWKDRRVSVPVLALVLLVISFGIVVMYVRNRNERTSQPNPVLVTQQNKQTSEEQTASTKTGRDRGITSTSGEPKTSKPSTFAPERQQQSGSVESSSQAPSVARNSTEETTGVGTVPGAETRSIRAERASTPLSAVKKVYIDVTGDEPLSPSLRQMLGEKLRVGNRIILVNSRDGADALLEVTVVKNTVDKVGTVKIQVELINPRGEVLWAKSGSKYQGSPADVSAKIARDLLAAVQESKRKK